MSALAQSFAKQAASDLMVYERLAALPMPPCHRLHYLQMWLEKLCKAYLWMPDLPGLETLRFKHNVVEKVLPRLIFENWRSLGCGNVPDTKSIRALCREVDVLHPQVDDNGRRPDNVEYPWIDTAGASQIPATWSFRLAERLNSREGRIVMKAAKVLTGQPNLFLRQV